MIFVTHIKDAKAAKDYYAQHLAPGDYYAKDAAELTGQWHGRGAERLGLSGELKQDDYFRLCENLDPKTGEQLTPRMDDDRRVLTDFTFDAPKSVSLAYELGGDDCILDKMRESVRETMAEIEESAMTRVRRDGSDSDRTTGNMVWSEHMHRTTRPVDGVPDPQLHCHATVFNATFDEIEQRWKAIQLFDIVRDKGYYQAAFHARLAGKLRDLGYGIQKDGNSFKLAAMEKATADKFSRRTAVIEAEAERLGVNDAKAKGNLGRKTREKKAEKPRSMAELRTEWNKRLTDEERVSVTIARNGWDQGDAKITPQQAKEYALEHSFQNASAVSEKRLKAEALTYAVGSVRPEDVADIAQHPEVIAVQKDGQLMTTTKTVLRDEVAMLQFAKYGQRKHQPMLMASSSNETATMNTRIARAYESLAGLSEEQRKAALHILNSRDTVTGVVGKAGAGKTRMMRDTRDVLEQETGLHVYAFAPSSQASRGVLAKEGFKDAETLAMLLKNEKLQQKVRGQILWIDEAGLVSSRDMKLLMEVAKRGNNRVILSGDYIQHASVEAGDAFRLLEKEAGVKLARLSEIRRQTEPGYKKAVEAIAEGSGKGAQKGFDALDKMGCVVEATGEERHAMLVNDYLKAADDGKSGLIIAPTHAEGQRLTEELRDALKGRGLLGKEHEFKTRQSVGWSEAQKGDIRNYEPGMVVEFNKAVSGKRQRIDGKRVTLGGFDKGESAVVSAIEDGKVKLIRQDGKEAFLPDGNADRFVVYRTRDIGVAKGDRIRITKNGDAKVEGQAKGTRLNNGDIFTVEGFTKEGDIRLEKGKLLPKDWGHMSLGYVDTSYASQGKTVDRVFIATGSESLAAANQQQWYVSTTRGREMAKVYVESKADVRDAIARTGQRLSAVELTQTKLRDRWQQRFHQSWERNRVRHFLKNRAAAVADYWRDKGRQKDVTYA